MTTTNLPTVPLPVGAQTVSHWADLTTSTPTRYFETPHVPIPCGHGDVTVFVAGLQHADGRTEREIRVHQLHADDPITVGQARQIARALISAANAVERWSSKG